MRLIEMHRNGWRRAVYDGMQGLPVPFWVRVGLSPLWLASQGYRVAARAHRMGYTSGVRRRLPCPVVSIGNLTLGGTGKTPLTEWTAQWYRRQGWRVAVLSRGYGGASTKQPRVVSAGDGPIADWRTAGDEAYLLARRLPGVPVLVGRNRYASGLYACERFGAQVVVLDDGFQHHALHRDCDIVLIDASNPFGCGALLPRGTLREPLGALRRAQVIVLSRVETAGDAVSGLCERIRRYADGNRSTAWPSARRVCIAATQVARWTRPGFSNAAWWRLRVSAIRAPSSPAWPSAGHAWRRFWPSRIITPTPRQTGRPFAMPRAVRGWKPWSPRRKTPFASIRPGCRRCRFTRCVLPSILPRTIRR